MTDLLTIDEVAKLFNVTKKTIRVWDEEGKLKSIRTLGGHRRYNKTEIDDLLNTLLTQNSNNFKSTLQLNNINNNINNDIKFIENDSIKSINNVVLYARVSSHDQKLNGDLQRQIDALTLYALNNNYNILNIITDVASGLNDNRKGLNKLIDLITSNTINHIIIQHKDRLTRYNYNIINKLFNLHNISIIITETNNTKNDFNHEIVDDLLSILTSFSGKLYGKRSHQNTKKINHV